MEKTTNISVGNIDYVGGGDSNKFDMPIVIGPDNEVIEFNFDDLRTISVAFNTIAPKTSSKMAVKLQNYLTILNEFELKRIKPAIDSLQSIIDKYNFKELFIQFD